jgi:D-alanyl-D-alanine carboxypeptidase
MGWDNEDSPMTVAGQAYGKDGALWWDSNNNNVQDNGDAGLQTFVIKFPNGIELSLVINSIPGSNYRSLVTLVRNAYDNAWVKQ